MFACAASSLAARAARLAPNDAVAVRLPALPGGVEAEGLAAAGRGDYDVAEPIAGEQAFDQSTLVVGQARVFVERGRRL